MTNKVSAERSDSGQSLPWSQQISLDSYYLDNSVEREEHSDIGDFYRNFDVDNPAALDLELASQHINLLGQGRTVAIPDHDIATGVSTMNAKEVRPSQFIFVEGLFALSSQLTEGLEKDFPRLQVFVDASAQEIQRRWFDRIEKMGETANWEVPETERPFYFDRVKNAAEEHILPAKDSADMVVNGESPQEYRNHALARLSGIIIDALQSPQE